MFKSKWKWSHNGDEKCTPIIYTQLTNLKSSSLIICKIRACLAEEAAEMSFLYWV